MRKIQLCITVILLLCVGVSDAYSCELGVLMNTSVAEVSMDEKPTETKKERKARLKAEKERQKAIEAKREKAGGFSLGDDYSIRDFKPLGMAIMNYDNDEVKRLLGSGVSASQMQGLLTPLYIAVATNNVEAVKLLMSSTTVGNINNKYTCKEVSMGIVTCKKSIIVDAIEIGNPEVLKLIIDKKPLVDFVYEVHYTSPGSPTTMESQSMPILLAANKLIDIKAGSTEGYNGFDGKDQLEQLVRLLGLTKNVNKILTQNSVPSAPGNAPMKSYGVNSPQPMSLMMWMNNIGQKNPEGNEYFNSYVCAFIDKGVRANYQYPVHSPAQYAIMKKNGIPAAAINAIKKENPMIRNVDCKYNSTILKYMLSKGWKLDHGGDKGAAFFVSLQHIPTIKMLVEEKGMDINMKNKMEQSILFFNTGNIDVVEAVLNLGADPNIPGPGGKTVKEMTMGISPKNRKKLHKLLDEHGAK